MLRFPLHVAGLRALRRVQPQRDAAIAMVIDDIGREGLAAHPEVGRAMRDHLFGFGEPQADLADRTG